MNKQERLRAVLAGERVDVLPCGFWHHFAQEYWTGEKSIAIHESFYRQTDSDIVKMMNEYTYSFGREITTVGDWAAIKPLDVKAHYADYLAELRELRRRLGPDVPIFATVHGLLVSACHATDGPGQFSNPANLVTLHLGQEPDAVSKGLATVAESLGDLCDACYDAGVDGIYYAALGGEEHRFSKELFGQYVKPLECSILERAKSRGITMLHICKDKVRLPMYADYPADVINWAIYECDYGLREGRQIFPGKTLLGGYDDRSGELAGGNCGEIEARARAIVDEAGRERLIVGADCTLPEDVSYERIRGAIQAARCL